MQMFKKILLKPNKTQERRFIDYAHVVRFVHNELVAYFNTLALAEQKSLDRTKCLKHIKDLNLVWLATYPESLVKRTVDVFLCSLKKYFDHNRRRDYAPVFWKKSKSKLLFNVLSAGLSPIDDTHVHIVGIRESVRHKAAVINSSAVDVRVYFDGKYWYLVYATEIDEPKLRSTGERIGIDLGIHTFAFCSNWEQYSGINNTDEVSYLQDYIFCLNKKIQHRKHFNGNIESKNVADLRKKLVLAERKLENIRSNFLHEVSKRLTRTTVGCLVIEDLCIPAMMQNEELAPLIKAQQFDRFRHLLTYKCQKYGVKLIVADRYFPSTKRCSNCGYVVSHIPLSARTYHCPRCRASIDRDANAAINLRNYSPNWRTCVANH